MKNLIIGFLLGSALTAGATHADPWQNRRDSDRQIQMEDQNTRLKNLEVEQERSRQTQQNQEDYKSLFNRRSPC